MVLQVLLTLVQIAALAREVSLERALGTDLDRAGGAAQAGNTGAERRQIAAAVKYALSDAKLLDARPHLLAAVARVLRSLPAGRDRPTVKDFKAVREALVHHRFPAQYTALARSVGITASELALYRLILLSSPEPPRLSAAEIVGSPTLARAAREAAKLLRVFAKSAPKTVGLREARLPQL